VPDVRRLTLPTGLDPLFWRVLAGVLVSAVGTGMTMPFLLVYLHNVRGIGTTAAALVIAWLGLVAIAVTPAAGALTDRMGPMPLLIGGQLVVGVGSVGLAFTGNVPMALLTTGLASVGFTAATTAESTLISRLARDAAQEWVFGLQFLVFSAGIGIGALLAGLVVDVTNPASFQIVFLVDAASYFIYAAVMLTMRGAGKAPAVTSDDNPADAAGPAERIGFRAVWKDRAMRRVLIIAAVTTTCAGGQVESGFPAYATQVALVSPRVLALAFVANTVTIVIGQLVLLPNIVGRSRSRLIALGCMTWAVCWVLVWAASGWAGTPVAASLVVVAFVVFSFGEIIVSPTEPSVVNALAPEQLRGRYNAALSLTFNLGSLLAPVMTGLLFGAGLTTLWAALIVVGNLLAGVLALRLRRHLTGAQDGLLEPAAAT
jgi:MFS family permease